MLFAQSVRLFVTSWTVACQAFLSMGLPSQEYWSELPFPSPGDLPKPGIEPKSLALASRFFTTGPPRLYFHFTGGKWSHREVRLSWVQVMAVPLASGS